MSNETFWDRYIEAYSNIFSNLGSYQSLLTAHQTGLGNSSRILDSGAGAGLLTLKLLEDGKEVYAVDESQEGLTRLTQVAGDHSNRLHTQTLDAHNLPYSNEFFDGVSSMLVVHFLEDPIRYLQEHARVLSPRGRLVVSGPSDGARDKKYIVGRWVGELKASGKLPELRGDLQVLKESMSQFKGQVHNFYDGSELARIIERETPLKVDDVKPNPLYDGRGYIITATK